ncbi:MAG: hypothetical protein AB9903_34180 [Vulcanimicrobiota bacterium]
MNQEDENINLKKSSDGTVKIAKVLIVLVIIFCTLAGISAAVYYFVFDVKLTDKARCDEIYQMTMKRMQDTEKVPPQENGYNVLAHITGNNASSQASAPYQALSKYCYGKTSEIEAGLLKDKKQTEKDIKAFSMVVPEIEKTISQKYYFFPSNGDFGIDAACPNYLVMRSIAQSLAALGVYKEIHNKPTEAAECYMLSIMYGARIGSHGFLITQMISIAIEAIGVNPLHTLIAKGNMKSRDYRNIIAELDALPVEKDDFLHAMDEEYARTLNTLEDLKSGNAGKTQTFTFNIPPLKVKFIIEREKRFYMNLYLKNRPCFEKLCMPEELGMNFNDDLKALNKKMSIICAILFPNFPRAITQKKFIMTEISALKVMAALQSYKKDKGKYPSALNDLCPGYLKSLPEDYMSKDRSFTYTSKGKTFSLTSQSEFYGTLSMKNPFSFYPPDNKVF